MTTVRWPYDSPPRLGLSWADAWEGPDDGLVACYEAGRVFAAANQAAKLQAKAGHLIPLPWKGGLAAKLKASHKYGCLYYLAMWQGIRGDNLLIETAHPTTLTCTRFGTQVTFTSDRSKWDADFE